MEVQKGNSQQELGLVCSNLFYCIVPFWRLGCGDVELLPLEANLGIT